MNINISYDLDPTINLYTLRAATPEGEVILECLSLEEVKRITIGELLELTNGD